MFGELLGSCFNLYFESFHFCRNRMKIFSVFEDKALSILNGKGIIIIIIIIIIMIIIIIYSFLSCQRHMMKCDC